MGPSVSTQTVPTAVQLRLESSGWCTAPFYSMCEEFCLFHLRFLKNEGRKAKKGALSLYRQHQHIQPVPHGADQSVQPRLHVKQVLIKDVGGTSVYLKQTRIYCSISRLSHAVQFNASGSVVSSIVRTMYTNLSNFKLLTPNTSRECSGNGSQTSPSHFHRPLNEDGNEASKCTYQQISSV